MMSDWTIAASPSCQHQHEIGQGNQKLHNPDSPLLIGEIKEGDVVKEVNDSSYIDTQQKLI